MKRLISMTTAAGLLTGALLLPAISRAEDKKDAKAETHEGDGRAGQGREKPGLTEEQEGKLKTLRRAHREAREAGRAELKSTMRKLEDQLEDKAPEKELTATLDKLRGLRKTMAEEQEKFMDAMAKLLTPTQRAEMAVAKARQTRGHNRGGMHGGPAGWRGRGKPHGDRVEREVPAPAPDHEDD